MRVIFIETMANDRQTFLSGKEYDLPDAEAKSAIKGKVAKEVKAKVEPKPEPKPEEKPQAKAQPEGK